MLIKHARDVEGKPIELLVKDLSLIHISMVLPFST